MTVNRVSMLTKGYFISYLTLIMTSREYTLTQANSFALDFFFKGDKERYGSSTWSQSEKAKIEIEKKIGRLKHVN
ncbi:hypothetical protein C7Y47_07330 [Lysinibacillus sphaericus]|uniref:Uncharacterized protein n=1 Tax=Lysinibacillus sphaericus TaxID=1421 RepID=A0A544UQG1_LYSSH|nr:hypothetical protein [Lysinibacillus sp. SDF0037]TQR36082.1 hypothetical protein C7Y47_07330 [Lysinibacillus sp. SDF0037]